MTPPTDSRGALFILLRELSASIDNLAYHVLHDEASTANLATLARECSEMSAALDRYAATLPTAGPTVEAQGS